MRTLLKSLTLIVSIGLLVAACSGGYSAEDAAGRCDIDTANNSLCSNDETYAACLDCYEECGDECVVVAGCPISFACSSAE